MVATAPACDTTLEPHRVISAAFDPDFYRATYADVPFQVAPHWHYALAGWREGRDPAPWFSNPGYLGDYPDVAAAGVDPLFHFLVTGWRQGREVRPSRHAVDYLRQVGWSPGSWGYERFAVGSPPSAWGAVPPHGVALSPAEQRALVAPEFDADYYLTLNPDLAESETDPLKHFLETGWMDGRDPNPFFSVRDYLDMNPDLAAAPGLNPFAHYLFVGRAEGRLPGHDRGFRYDLIAGLTPVGERIEHAVAAALRTGTQSTASLARRLAPLRDLHITLSHDNYVEHTGGLQLCVRRESARFAAMGVDHLHLFPATPWPAVRAADEPGRMGVLLNGRDLGVFGPQSVAEALPKAPGARRSFAVHSLLGHAADDTADILEAAGLDAGFFWLHDFASLCAGFHLLRDDVEDCGAPPADSAACAICAYGPVRARHTEAHRRLFERLALTVVAPSQATLDFWRAHTDLPARDAIVLPHVRLVPRAAAARAAREGRLRVAFLGAAVPLKGWPVFRQLAREFANDPRYEFLHLGARPDPVVPARFHPVAVTAERPDAMAEAVAELEVDVALIWPLCRETFSFTAYEAAAGGAAVVTGPDSGNVAAFAADPAVGRVLETEAALAQAFVSGEILSLARGRRNARSFGLAFSGLTGELAP